MKIQEIKTKWNKEKESYKKQEVGSGVQIFVKDILNSESLFNLKKGLKSTTLENRKNEFLEEEKTKAQRKADIVIFISSDIVIPVEVEKYQNIEAGKNQLLNYQSDLDKKYGILTDGYSWRFYNNNIFREFNLKHILDKTEIFLDFWKEYIKPEFYYLAFFEPKGQLSLLKDTEKLQVEQNRYMFFEDITKLIRGFKNKLQIEGYFEELDKKEKEKRAIEITYAYIIQFILYKTLVDNDFSEFAKEYKDNIKKIHKYIKNKRYKDILGVIDGISNKISRNIYRPFAKEQEFINQKLSKLYRVENKLSDVSPWLDIFVFIKKYNFANIENEIFGYIYENYLKELFEEKQKGQYFTDPDVVNFMLQQVGFSPDKIKKRYQFDKKCISLIDPACGSGTFLYSAVNTIINAFGNHTKEKSKRIEKIVNNNIFGLDIAEFPLYLAEMNILMRMLPLIITEEYNNPIDKKIKVFLSKDSISEFLDTAIRNTIHDIDVKGGQLSLGFKDLDLGYKSYVREESDLEKMKQSLESKDSIPRRRFDYVIGNPPYISYKQCSKQKALFLELMKKRRIKLSNIYGVNLHSIPDSPKRYAPNPNLYAFFIALGIALLKDNGKLCYIIPQTILTASDLDVIRYHLAKFTTIEKIITFSGKMFIGRGLKQNKLVSTSSLILVLNRKIPSATHQVEIINYKNPDDSIEKSLQNILNGKKINRRKVLQNKLLINVVNWNFIKQNKKFLDFYNEYKIKTKDISIYYDHSWAKHQFKSKFYFDRGVKYPKDKITLTSNLTDEDFYYISKNIKDGFMATTTDKGIAKNLLDFPFGSQGDIVYQKKYKIIWRYINYDRFHFSEDKIMIDYNNVIISSDNKNEVLYLFSLLNSKISINILERLLKNEYEKDILIGIKSIKEFVRIPKITENNQEIKKETIKTTEEMLTLEKRTLSNFVDFSKIMIQKFDTILTKDDNLILKKDDKKFILPIKKDKELIKKIIKTRYPSDNLDTKKEKINLSELKSLPAIDLEKQKQLKDYIDDLLFALYFNITLERLGLNKSEKIKIQCLKNPHYKLVN